MIIILLLLCLACLTSCQAKPTTGETVTINKNSILTSHLSYDYNTDYITNDGQGLAKRIDLTWSEENITGFDKNTSTGFYLLLSDLSYYSKKTNNVEDLEISDNTIDKFKNILNCFRANNSSLVLRFTYDKFQGLDNQEPDFNMVLKHFEKIVKVIDLYPYTIYSFECGFLSKLGDMSGGNIVSNQNVAKLIDIYLENVTSTKLFLSKLDYIYSYVGIERGDLSEISEKDLAKTSKFGVYDNGQIVQRIIDNNFDQATITWSKGHNINLSLYLNKDFDLNLLSKDVIDKLFEFHLTYFSCDNLLLNDLSNLKMDNINILNYLNMYSGFAPLINYFDVVRENNNLGFIIYNKTKTNAPYLKDLYYTIYFISNEKTIEYSDKFTLKNIEQGLYGLTYNSYDVYIKIYNQNKTKYFNILNDSTRREDMTFFLGKISY